MVKPSKLLYVRLVLACLLLYGVYYETGVFTTVALGLLFCTDEVQDWVLKKIKDLRSFG